MLAKLQSPSLVSTCIQKKAINQARPKPKPKTRYPKDPKKPSCPEETKEKRKQENNEGAPANPIYVILSSLRIQLLRAPQLTRSPARKDAPTPEHTQARLPFSLTDCSARPSSPGRMLTNALTKGRKTFYSSLTTLGE